MTFIGLMLNMVALAVNPSLELEPSVLWFFAFVSAAAVDLGLIRRLWFK